MNVKKARALIAIGATSTDLDTGLRDARKKLRMFDKESRSLLGKGASLFGKGMALGAGALAGGGIIDTMMDAAHGAVAYSRALTRFQINAEMSKAELADFDAQVMKTSNSTGVSRDDVLAAASAYVGFTGNAKNAREQLQLFAEVSQATGTSMTDVAGIASTFDKNLKLDPSQWRAAFDIIAKQAHVGGVELKNVADKMAPLGAMYAGFLGGASTGGFSRLSAMSQVLQNMTHNTDETTTALKDMFLALNQNAGKLRQFKIEPFAKDANGNKVLKDPLELLDAIKKSPLAKDPELLQKVFPEMRGRGALQYLLSTLDAVHQIARESENSNQIANDYAIQQESAAGKLDKAMNGIKNAVAKAFTPERIQLFADVLTKVAQGLDTIIEKILKIGDFIDKYGESDKEIQTKIEKHAASLPPAQRAAYMRDVQTAGYMKAGAQHQARSGIASIFLGSAAAAAPDQGEQLGTALSSLGGGMSFSEAPSLTGNAESNAYAAFASQNGWENRLANKIAAAMKSVTVVVKMDAETAAKKIDNVRRPQPRT